MSSSVSSSSASISLRRRELFAALRADPPHQPLGQDRLDRGRDQERRHAHVAQPRDRAGGVVGVQRAEHHVPGERRLHGDLGRFQVADLADQDLVRDPAARMARRQVANVMPMSASIGTWTMPSMSYSTGSSVVISLSSMLFSSLSAE